MITTMGSTCLYVVEEAAEALHVEQRQHAQQAKGGKQEAGVLLWLFLLGVVHDCVCDVCVCVCLHNLHIHL